MNTAKFTALVAPIIAAQSVGKVVCVIDMTREFNVLYAAELGVNVARLLVSQPDDAEQGAEILETLARSGAIDIVEILGWSGELPRKAVDCAALSGCALMSV
jgi:recombination protein RecA